MDERTCTTCAYGEQSYNEWPCYVCDSHFSKWEKWEHVDDDEDDDEDEGGCE